MNAFDFIRIARDAGAKLSADGPLLVVEAEDPPPPQVFDMLRTHKPEILELLYAERRAVIRYVNNNFQSSPLGQCAHCGGAGNTFVAMFVGENRADIHAMCHPAWIAAREAKARVALGFDTPAYVDAERDAELARLRAKGLPAELGWKASELFDVLGTVRLADLGAQGKRVEALDHDPARFSDEGTNNRVQSENSGD